MRHGEARGQNHGEHDTHGWLIAALLREMSGLEGKAMFECVESSFAFDRCLRQGSIEQKMATQLLANVEEEWVRKRYPPGLRR